MSDVRIVISVAILVFAAVGVTVVTLGVGQVTAGHDSPGNWTVVPGDPEPGADRVSYKHFAVGQAAWDDSYQGKGLQKVDYMVLTWEAGSFAECTLFNAEAFGFDRGNDDPGTETDDFAGAYIEDFNMGEDKMWMDFYEEDDAGSATHFDRHDQFIAHQTDCYQNPDEAGWYRVFGWMNGTDYNGVHSRAELFSHYFYICECDSREEARETIGPPPSESTPTMTATPSPTPTPTPTPTATPAGTTYPAPDSPTPTKTSAVTTTVTSTQTATPRPTTAGAEPTDNDSTTTATDQPGLGLFVGLVALLMSVLSLARQR